MEQTFNILKLLHNSHGDLESLGPILLIFQNTFEMYFAIFEAPSIRVIKFREYSQVFSFFGSAC